MCNAKARVEEFGEGVTLCCDEDLFNGNHHDKIHNIEWKYPEDHVTVKVPLVPPKVVFSHATART